MVKREVKIDIFDHWVPQMKEEKNQIQVVVLKFIFISQDGSYCVK